MLFLQQKIITDHFWAVTWFACLTQIIFVERDPSKQTNK